LRIQANVRRTVDELDALRGLPAGHLSVGVGPVEAIAIMSEALTRFLRVNSTTQVSVREGFSTMLEPALLEGTLDFIVGGGGRGNGASAISPLRAELLGYVKPAVVVRKQHPLARKAHVQITDLARAAWIVPHGSGVPFENFVGLFAGAGLPAPSGRIRAATTSWTALGLVMRSDVVALLPEQLIHSGVESGDLKILNVGSDFYAFPAYLVSRDDVIMSSAATALVAEIRSVCRERSGRLS
jgi:DNA-binding transcriptional LysR family regulator